MLTKKLDLQSKPQKCVLGDRIMACLFVTPSNNSIFPIPKGTRVWFREIFEPTISLVELRPASDLPDDGGDDGVTLRQSGPSEAPPNKKQKTTE